MSFFAPSATFKGVRALYRFAWFGIFFGFPALLAAPVLSHAEDQAQPVTSPSKSPGNETSGETVSKSRSSKGKHPREKEIEGTEARDRFQADTVIKSKYQLNGEQLEVDPD